MKEEALKLADELKQQSELGWAGDLGNRLNESSDMIRKLVAKIEVTERDYNFMYSYAKGLEQVEKDLKAELEKEKAKSRNSANSDFNNCFTKTASESLSQTKPLSDDEIMKEWQKAHKTGGSK